MKKSISLLSFTVVRHLFFLFLICICKSGNAQEITGNDSLDLKPKIYKANILIYSNKEIIKGYVANLSDTGLALSSSPVQLSLEKKNNPVPPFYNYDQLRQVTIQRKGSVGRGAAYGALIGIGVGVITGLVSGNDSPGWFSLTAGQKAIRFGVMGIPVGALAGVLLGETIHKKFIIGGNKKKFEIMRQNIFK